MPNGKHVRGVPQLEGVKPRHLMNKIDRNGLGPWIVNFKKDNPTLGWQKISDALLAETGIHVAWREIGNYLSYFKDPITGEMCNLDILPKLPDRYRFNPVAIAQTLKEVLEESEISDAETLETMTYQGLAWFKDERLPIPLRLKVAKELRETIRLKLELAGIAKPAPTTVNNNLNVSSTDLAKLMESNPAAVSVIRDLIYMAGQMDAKEQNIRTIEMSEVDDTE